jgi:hypothetical protein
MKFQAVEKLPWYSLSPQIGYQTRRFWGVSSPVCGLYQLNADFFNRLVHSRKLNARARRSATTPLSDQLAFLQQLQLPQLIL